MIDEKTLELIIQDVVNEIMSWPQSYRDEFLITGYDGENLSAYHPTLGRYIRNRYHLWNTEWEPDLDENGVDYSPNHPDNISMLVIKQAWKRCSAKNDVWSFMYDG